MPCATCSISNRLRDAIAPGRFRARLRQHLRLVAIFPALPESYTTAAARGRANGVGYWKTPTEATYLAPGDTRRTLTSRPAARHPRCGMQVRHDFAADGDYKFSIRTSHRSYIPGEQLGSSSTANALTFQYQGVGLTQGMSAKAMAHWTRPFGESGIAGGGRDVSGHELRPSSNMIRQYDRKSLENNTIPAAPVLPGDRDSCASGPVHRAAAGRFPQHAQVFTCHPRTHRSAVSSGPPMTVPRRS